ncbi:MAG: hypothetical protein HYZ00_14350, partial [Candidatus Hydrogenedentes bacterium]|nr:hypothetical protein [Candidatus Hydrogenedentota bacterium]
MADNSILWQGSRIVDGFVRPRRPWAFLAGVFALVLFADVVLEAALQEQRSALDLEVNNGEDLRHQLQRTVDDPAQPWLLVGDSVLAGDVLAGKAKEWRNRRIVDYMRQEKSDRYPDMFYQVALNGLLPTDIRAIVTELDRLDPQGRVRLVVQLNPRYFSKYYSGLRDTTRAWLGRDTQAVAAWGEVNWVKWAVQEVRNGGLWLKEHAPVYRHAAWLHWPPGDFPVRLTPKGQTEARAGGALLGAVRIREHYTGLNLSVASRQVQALMDIHRRLEARGRQGLFFLTPLNDSFLDELSGPDAYGRTVAQIRAIFGNDTGLVRFVNLDHPLFTPEMFLDHCHLWPDGNRLLAMNLLHEMNIAVHQMPDVQQTAYTEDPEQALVWNTARGYADGAGWQALFKRPRGLVVAGPNRLLIADTENHCLREVIGARPIVRTLAGLPGASGYKDGKAEEALLSAPAYPCLLNGALYFIDRQGALLRRYEDGLVFTEYVAQGPAWRALNMLRAHDGCLYALDQKSTILRYAPQTHETRVVYASRPEASVRAFDISPDGRLFVVDNRNRVALYRLGAEQDTGPVTSPQIIFPNEATELIAADDYFPLPFDRVQLREVLDIRYIRRYDGLLVQDYLAPKKLYEEEVSRGEAWSFSEGVQLRFLRLADNMVYPWRYPSARESEMLYNAATESHISPFRIGSLAVDPDTAATYYLERDRSYLFRMEDGLWGAAKYSNDTPVRYGLNLLATTGEFVRLTVHPEQFLTQRDAVLPKRGPFLALFLGSSMTGMSDLTGQLSLLHLASSELERNLGYCEGVRLETLVRNQAGAKVDDSVRAFEDFVAGGGRADVPMLEFVNPGAEEEQFL